jgi:CheY-like chemotaxis protein
MAELLRILAVDDEPSIVASMQVIFEGSRFIMTTAQDGGDALDQVALGSPPYDVVITDSNMPRLSGVEFVRKLRQDNFAGKIVVISAHLSAELCAAYQELKVDMMIEKPFDIHRLRETLEQLAA